MLINTDSEAFKDMCVIRKARKRYEKKGDYESGLKINATFNRLVAEVAKDLVKQIDESIKELRELNK